MNDDYVLTSSIITLILRLCIVTWWHIYIMLISQHGNIQMHVSIVTLKTKSCHNANFISIGGSTGPLFIKKTPSYGYRNPHYKPKTVVRLSQVYNGNPYTDKTASS